MGISNIASNLRPGICTSTTRPTTPYEGQVIYETDTNRTLVWDNAAWVDPSTGKAERSGLVKIVPTSVTGGTIAGNGDVTIGTTESSLIIENAFPTDFVNFLILLQGGSTSNSNPDIRVKLRTAANVNSDTGYYSALVYSTLASATPIAFNSNNAAEWANSGASVSTTQPNMNMTLLSPNQAIRTTVYNGFVRGDAVGAVNGWHDVATAYTGIRIAVSAGTFTGCVVRIYGYN